MKLKEKFNKHIENRVRSYRRRENILHDFKGLLLNLILFSYIIIIINPNINNVQIVLLVIFSIFAIHKYYIFDIVSKLNKKEILIYNYLSDDIRATKLFRDLEYAILNIKDFDSDKKDEIILKIQSTLDDTRLSKKSTNKETRKDI